MFGYERGASHDAISREVRERAFAQRQWPFLTTLDLSTIHTADQLKGLVRDRVGFANPDTDAQVDEWMMGYSSRRSALAAGPFRKVAGRIDRPRKPR
ncbi:MAG: hypothetical protein EOP22_14355 [Hyphomicrobiales bacterium]|nr:MAG: hypothetical protein EOP22_14355 [Hyphomicrobiales bacterium]